jgi:N-acetylglucosamine-6-phosphate deacetylase
VARVKGTLREGADADLVVLEVKEGEGGDREVLVDEVWKFGVKVFEREVI